MTRQTTITADMTVEEIRAALFGPVTARAIIHRRAPEREMQAHIEAMLADCGWRFHHETDSRKSDAGWPDLVCVRVLRRYEANGALNLPFVLFLELKTEAGKLRPQQQELWAELDQLDSDEVRFAIVRPSTLAPIEAMITRGWLPERAAL